MNDYLMAALFFVLFAGELPTTPTRLLVGRRRAVVVDNSQPFYNIKKKRKLKTSICAAFRSYQQTIFGDVQTEIGDKQTKKLDFLAEFSQTLVALQTK